MQQHEVAERLIINLSKCEPWVQEDVLRRCSDWLEFGGKLDDPYILNQLQFTDRYLALLKAKESLT